MLSEWSRQGWTEFAEARVADVPPFVDRDRLIRFLVGVHVRGEELSAQELKGLIDETGLTGQPREHLVSLIDAGMALLAHYDFVLEEDERSYDEDQGAFGGFKI